MRVPRAQLAPGYTIPRLINGAWQLAADHRERPPDVKTSVDALLQLADHGLTAFDCADIYTGVERLLGHFLRAWSARGADRDTIQIHTKFVPDRDALARVDRLHVERIIDRSLARLGVERLDLVQFYWWDFNVPGWVDTAGWLSELRDAGKIRHIGVTNFDTVLLRRLIEAGLPIVANQVQYSLLDRRPELTLANYCHENGIALLCYGALGGGFLTERWRGVPDPGTKPGNRSLVKYRLIIDEFGGWAALQRLLDDLASIADRHRLTLANVALAWSLTRRGVAGVILGARTANHAMANLAVFDQPLEESMFDSLKTVLGEHAGPTGDVFGLERTPDGRHAAIMKTDLNRTADKETPS